MKAERLNLYWKGMVQPSDFDDDVMRCSLFGIEYGALAKTVVLTYQKRTLRYSFSSIAQASRS